MRTNLTLRRATLADVPAFGGDVELTPQLRVLYGARGVPRVAARQRHDLAAGDGTQSGLVPGVVQLSPGRLESPPAKCRLLLLAAALDNPGPRDRPLPAQQGEGGALSLPQVRGMDVEGRARRAQRRETQGKLKP